jgi:magnesium chelatase subunit D
MMLVLAHEWHALWKKFSLLKIQTAAMTSTSSPDSNQAASEQASMIWQRAVQVAVLFALDPVGTGGVRLRASAGPVRDMWLTLLRNLLGVTSLRRMPLSITDERLLGGLDLPATLASGRPVLQKGLLAEIDGSVVLLAMAERLPTATAARLCAVMDNAEVRLERDGLTVCTPTRFGVVALDEGQSDDETVVIGLRDRLAFDLDLSLVSPRVASAADFSEQWITNNIDIAAARKRLANIQVSDDIIAAVCGTALALGVDSSRASLLALRVARVNAALDENEVVTEKDASIAAQLVLGPRATRLPSMPEPEQTEQEEVEPEPQQAQPPEQPPQTQEQQQAAESEPPPENQNEQSAAQDAIQKLEDKVLDATQAAIPAGLLSQLMNGNFLQQRAASGKSGAPLKNGQRGRPAGSRRAMPAHGQRLHLIDTLRAAAPWQKLRRTQLTDATAAKRVQVRAEDFHITRIKQKTGTTTLFVVDASGSSALHRLAEAKGAVELLLADCYVRRDQVAVIAFRGKTAEILLPPTRSLVRAKRSLSGLPGGGGTPLAAAIDAAASLADDIRRKGQTPVIVMLTDGRANVARDGSGGREKAMADAMASATRLRLSQAAVLLIDTSPQPQASALQLAHAMTARYLPLPHAGANAMSQAVRSALQEGS